MLRPKYSPCAFEDFRLSTDIKAGYCTNFMVTYRPYHTASYENLLKLRRLLTAFVKSYNEIKDSELLLRDMCFGLFDNCCGQ